MFQKKSIKDTLLVLLFTVAYSSLFATHNRAGEILYEFVSPLSYKATIITYSKVSGASASADRDSLSLDWGDGFVEVVPRINGGGQGVLIENDIKKNIYQSDVHTYSGALPYYIISVTDQNRIENIINIAGGIGSVNEAIYFEDTIFYVPPQLFENNSSPILLNPPIDYGNVNDTFYHNPNAYDPNGDSLHFSLVPSRRSMTEQVSQYRYPDQINPGPNNQMTINPITGEIIWATPQAQGTYNIAILIKEYRAGRRIGTMIRDMEIFIDAIIDDPPQIVPLNDTCIIAGTTFSTEVRATDPNGELVTLSAYGAPFEIDPSRVNFTANVGNPAIGQFSWTTLCSDIRPQFYQVVIKAEDQVNGGNNVVLSDLESWRIHVVPPPPEGLIATFVSNDIHLEWNNPYGCFDSDKFQYFSVWRKIACDSLDISFCDLGLDGTGYTMIADSILDYNFIDSTVSRGNSYSYRILAHFGTNPVSSQGAIYNWVLSAPSNEACIELPLDIPVITNVSVDVTNPSTGEMYVRWSKPKAGSGLLDTILDPPPYIFEVYSSNDSIGANFNILQTFTANSYATLNDTIIQHLPINTVDNPHSYKVVFKSDNGNIELGETDLASSIYLSIDIGDQKLQLNWNENVPWINTSYSIFRSNSFNGVYDSITSVASQFYLDENLINDSTYCYYIVSRGYYTNPNLVNPIINYSQRVCEIPIDTTAPCAPDVLISNDCDSIPDQIWSEENFENTLLWEIETCNEDAVQFNIYYASDNLNYTLIHQTNETSYTHKLGNTLAGCYILNAIDENGNIGKYSDTICVENCAYYELPNAFTPNGDGDNDVYTPFPGWRFVEKIEIKIFNRWGNLVWQTENPNINWDGTDQKSHKPLNDGVYLYNGYYFVRSSNGELDKRPLPYGKRGGGYIHLIRDK